MTPESTVKKHIDRILKPYVLAGQLAYEKTAGSMYGKNGWPDYGCCLLGAALYVEAKACPRGRMTPGKPTALQDARHADIRRAGGTVLIIHENNLFELARYLEQEVAKHDRA
jgi:hypothetical protein